MPHRDLHNPALQRFYSVLQAIALKEEVPAVNEADNALRPMFKLDPEDDDGDDGGGHDDGMEGAHGSSTRRRKSVILQFKTAIDLADDACDAAKKKRTGGAAAGASAKKQKAEIQIPPEDIQQWKDWKADGLLSAQKNDVLKEICKAFGVKVSGKKDELLERIEQELLKY